MPGSMPATSQLDWLSSTTAMIVLFWSRATRDLLKSFGWGIAALHRLDAATKLPFPRRPPHSIYRSRIRKSGRCQIPAIRPWSVKHFGGGAVSSLESRDIQLSVERYSYFAL